MILALVVVPQSWCSSMRNHYLSKIPLLDCYASVTLKRKGTALNSYASLRHRHRSRRPWQPSRVRLTRTSNSKSILRAVLAASKLRLPSLLAPQSVSKRYQCSKMCGFPPGFAKQACQSCFVCGHNEDAMLYAELLYSHFSFQ